MLDRNADWDALVSGAYACREAEAVCPDDGNLLADDGVCGFCGNAPAEAIRTVWISPYIAVQGTDAELRAIPDAAAALKREDERRARVEAAMYEIRCIESSCSFLSAADRARIDALYSSIRGT